MSKLNETDWTNESGGTIWRLKAMLVITLIGGIATVLFLYSKLNFISIGIN